MLVKLSPGLEICGTIAIQSGWWNENPDEAFPLVFAYLAFSDENPFHVLSKFRL